MAMRTTAEKVREMLGPNYDSATTPKLTLMIRMANALVSRVVTCAANKDYTHSSDELELLEMMIACHYYTVQDKAYSSRSDGGASGSFQGQTGMGMESSDFGQSAMDFDTSGCLRNIVKRQVADADWLGKPANEQLSYEDRN